jgi:hypothetical protein
MLNRNILIIITTLIIIPSVGIQSKDTTGGGAFLGLNTHAIERIVELFVVFPICYFVFVRQVRKLNSNYIKGSWFLLQGLGILFFAFCIVDNSHPGVDMRSEAALYSIYKSDTFVFIYIIPSLNFIVATFYFLRIRITTQLSS